MELDNRTWNRGKEPLGKYSQKKDRVVLAVYDTNNLFVKQLWWMVSWSEPWIRCWRLARQSTQNPICSLIKAPKDPPKASTNLPNTIIIKATRPFSLLWSDLSVPYWYRLYHSIRIILIIKRNSYFSFRFVICTNWYQSVPICIDRYRLVSIGT